MRREREREEGDRQQRRMIDREIKSGKERKGERKKDGDVG